MLLHPDKHQNPEDKATAERKITVLNEAYEGLSISVLIGKISVDVVLSDPNKRAVYDQCGCEGLDAMKNMQVGQRLKTPAEVSPLWSCSAVYVLRNRFERNTNDID